MGVRAVLGRDADRARAPPALSRSPRFAKGIPAALRRGNGSFELSRLVQVRGEATLSRVVRGRRRPQDAEIAAPQHAGLVADGASPLSPDAVAEGREGIARQGEDGVQARRAGRIRAAPARAARVTAEDRT